jgi:hypothetical protein
METKKYFLQDGGVINATTPEDFIEQLKNGSRFESAKTTQQFMDAFAGRIKLFYSLDVATSTKQKFIEGLIACGYLTIEEPEQEPEPPTGPKST